MPKPHLPRLVATVVAAAASVAAVPATAPAATLSLDPARDCYRAGESVEVAAAGFTPNTNVLVEVGGDYVGHMVADPSGNTGGTLRLGSVGGVREQAITATDQLDGAIVATTAVRVADTAVRWRFNGRAGRKVRLRATGFVGAGRRLYAHIVRGGRVRTVGVGRLGGACGTLKAARRFFSASAKPGSYRVQFDTRRRYSPKAAVRARFKVQIYRTVRRG